MANVIKIRRSSNQHATPSTLEYGELAINYADGKLYYKNSSGTLHYFESQKDNLTLRAGQTSCLIEVISIILNTDSENQVLDTSSASSVKYLIQADDGESVEVTEILAVKKASTVNHIEYGRISMSNDLASYNVIESSGNIRLVVSPANENTKFDILKTIITT